MIKLSTNIDINLKLSIRQREVKSFVANLVPVFGDKSHIETLDLLKKLKKASSKADKIRFAERILTLNKK